MASATGPLRRAIGPMKQRVATHQQSATDLTHADTPTDIAPLRDHIRNLETIHAKLAAATATLRSKHDEWVRAIPDDEDEHKLYNDACDEITNLFLDTDDITCQINITIKDCRHELDLLQQPAQPAAGVLGQQAPTEAMHTAVPVATVPPPLPPGPPAPTPWVHSTAFKAPKIRLPTFDGDYMQFKQFWGIFESNIHNRPDLSNVEKFTYLVSQLEGDAEKAISGVLISDDNYDVAVALLKSRFDRADDRIVTLLYSELMGLEPCSDDFKDEQRTLDDCERIFRQLETAGGTVNSNQCLVVALLSKFPSDFVRDLQRHYKIGTNNSLSEVREGLRKYLADEETTAGVLNDLQFMSVSRENHGQAHKSCPVDDVDYDYENSGYQTCAMPSIEKRQYHQFSSRNPQLLTPPASCYFCCDHHFNGDCTFYATAAEREQRLAELGRCTRCLRFHKPNSGPCTYPIKCVYCYTTDDHATTLCHVRYSNQPIGPSPQAAPSSVPVQDQSTQNATLASGPELVQSGGVTALNSDTTSALFQTAKTVAINPVNGKRTDVRLALDTLSSRSYILEEVAQQLGLAINHNEKLSVSVFGTAKSLEVPTAQVEFDVMLRDGSSYRVHANTTKVICQTGIIPSSWTEGERQTLGFYQGALADDPFDPNGTVDILVGVNSVWDIIEGPKIPTPVDSISLIPSKFGLMLAGESHSNRANNQAPMCLTKPVNPITRSKTPHPVASKTKSDQQTLSHRNSVHSPLSNQPTPIQSQLNSASESNDTANSFRSTRNRSQIFARSDQVTAKPAESPIRGPISCPKPFRPRHQFASSGATPNSGCITDDYPRSLPASRRLLNDRHIASSRVQSTKCFTADLRFSSFQRPAALLLHFPESIRPLS